MQVSTLIPVDSLVFGNNVRIDHDIPSMVASILRHGFKPNHAIVVSRKPEGNLVLVGNRRGLATVDIKNSKPEDFKRLFPDGMIPAIVYSGLNESEEIQLRVDHGKDEDRKPLSQWETFLAISQLSRCVPKLTAQEIATKMGLFHKSGKRAGLPNHEWIQPRLNLARLPEYIREEYRKLCDDPDSTPVRWSMVAEFFKIMGSERAAYPNGDGPKLREAFDKVISQGIVTKAKPESLTPKLARDYCDLAGSQWLKLALLILTGQSDSKLTFTDVDSALKTMEEATGNVPPKPEAKPEAPKPEAPKPEAVKPEAVKSQGKRKLKTVTTIG